MDYIFLKNTIKSVINAFYNHMGASLVFAGMFTFVFMYYKERGLKQMFRDWIDKFLHDKEFLGIFFFMLYSAILLFRTILCRPIIRHPLSAFWGYWGLHGKNGALYTENLQNLMLFVPFTALLFFALRERIFRNGIVALWQTLWKSTVIGFVFSLFIETSQLVFHIGTFQLTDLAFNTLGGTCGGLAYYLLYRIWHYRKNGVRERRKL